MSVTAEILLTLSLWWYFYGWPGGWVSENGNKAISASIEVEVELSWVEAELGKNVVLKIVGPQILGSKKIKVCKKLGLKNLVKIWSVTAEIFLIWTNVSRTNVAWTNVTVTVGICERWSQEPSFKVWSKSGQYQLRYSLYGQMLRGQMLLG